MPTKEELEMDYSLKNAIKSFFQHNRGIQITYPEDFTEDLEEYLIDRGFDLSCILRYKNVSDS